MAYGFGPILAKDRGNIRLPRTTFLSVSPYLICDNKHKIDSLSKEKMEDILSKTTVRVFTFFDKMISSNCVDMIIIQKSRFFHAFGAYPMTEPRPGVSLEVRLNPFPVLVVVADFLAI